MPEAYLFIPKDRDNLLEAAEAVIGFDPEFSPGGTIIITEALRIDTSLSIEMTMDNIMASPHGQGSVGLSLRTTSEKDTTISLTNCNLSMFGLPKYDAIVLNREAPNFALGMREIQNGMEFDMLFIKYLNPALNGREPRLGKIVEKDPNT